MMKALVTGATGFIGKRLTERLIKEGVEVVAGGRSLGKLNDLSDKAKPVYIEIENPESIKNTVKKEKPDVVFHCAALVESDAL